MNQNIKQTSSHLIIYEELRYEFDFKNVQKPHFLIVHSN